MDVGGVLPGPHLTDGGTALLLPATFLCGSHGAGPRLESPIRSPVNEIRSYYHGAWESAGLFDVL